MIVIETSLGNMKVELDHDKAPKTVDNFLTYVHEEFYDNTIFHRVIKNFMIQGGGFTEKGQKPTHDPIKLEAGLKNNRGTIAMARTSDPNSATSQFFINTVNNEMLNQAPGNPGYAVFGKLVDGFDVLDKIASVETQNSPMPDWPVEPVTIISIREV